MILAALACPVFNSCADFSTDIEDLKGELADLEGRVEALEQKLNTDLAALQSLLQGQIDAINGEIDGINGDIADLLGKVNGLVTIKECKQNANGEYELTLSDGTKFTVYPKFEQNYEGIVTTITLDGVVYWAMFDAAGSPKAMTDKDGNLIPVVDAVPQTKKGDDGFFYVSFDGGQTWEPTGVSEPCVFAGAEVVYNEAMGVPAYVVLTLADGNTITVTIDGAAYFMFGNMYLGDPIEVQYVGYGTTTAVEIAGMNIQNWVKEVPAGWKVVENLEYFAEYGQGEFYVTAPSAEAIASGAAVAEGDLKVLAVAEGGKSFSAKIHLTTIPFGGLSASKGNVSVQMNKGLGGYLLGLSPVAEYDPEAIVSELKSVVEHYDEFENWQGEIMKEYTWSPWYTDMNATPLDDNYMDRSIEDYPIADLMLSTELKEGENYIVWAVALNAWFDDVTYSSGYTVCDIYSTPYLNAFITLDETATVLSFNEISVKIAFDGVTAFFGGFQEQNPDYRRTPADIVQEDINDAFDWGYAPNTYYVNDEYVSGWNDGVYEGDPNALVNGWQAIEPNKTYYLYLIPAVDGKTEYSVSDVYFYEFTTEALMSGGIATVEAGETEPEYKTISVPLSSEGAVYIYYSFVDPEMIPTIADKQAYLLDNGNMAQGESAIANMYNLTPATTKTLLAMAVDKYGCYGDVFQQDFTTKAYQFAAATVSAELQGVPAQTGYVKVACDGDVDKFYYYYGEKSSTIWTNAFGGTAEGASSYIALNSSYYYIKNIAPAEIAAEGILIDGLTLGAPYVFVVSAKLADGTFTKATVIEFTPTMDLGNFVYATDDNGNENAAWTAAKPKVTYNVDQVGDFAYVSWSVELPAGFSGKTACFSEDYLVSYPTAKDKVQYILSNEYIYSNDIVAGETYSQAYASKGYNIYTVIWDADGNHYETYVEKLDISGGFGV